MADIKALSQRIRGNRSDVTFLITAEAFDSLQEIVDGIGKRVAALENAPPIANTIVNNIISGGSTYGDYDLTIPVTNHIQIDMDNGINQRVLLGANDIVFDTPIRTSGPLIAGEPLVITVVSAAPSTNKQATFDPIFRGVSNLTIDMADGAATIFQFAYRNDDTWEIKGYFAGAVIL